MRAVVFKTSILACLLLGVAFVGAIPTSSDAGRFTRRQNESRVARKQASAQAARQLNYRSPGAMHKLEVSAEDEEVLAKLISARLASKARKVGSNYVIEVSDEALASLDAATLQRAKLRDDFNLVLLKRGQLDTTAPEPVIEPELKKSPTAGRSLHLAQLFGPPTPDSVAALKATGARLVSYVPNNAYLVWATPAQLQRIRALGESNGVVQWDGPYHPAYKIDPRIKTDDYAQRPTSIQILDTPQADATINRIKGLANEVLMDEFIAGGVIHIKVRAENYKAKEFALLADVLAVEPLAEMRLMDERANQIVAGAVSSQTSNDIQVFRPTAPGYLAFLNSVGFNSDFDFAIDVGDTGFDIGSADPTKVHPDFLNSAGLSRVAYLNDFTSDSHPDGSGIFQTHDISGHGTLNASIIGGFNTKTESAFADSLGFSYGMGTAPYARIGISKLFKDNGEWADPSYIDFIAAAYRGGARLSSNSWGNCDPGICNTYDLDSQVFDRLVRDADPDTFGNQSMVILFAAGNDGDARTQTVASPATAKNVITVGASENFRPTDSSGTNLRDGCGVGFDEANNSADIVEWSGYGPVADGRSKPDLIAPGTHVAGAASQDQSFKGDGVCGVLNSAYFPTGQKLYTLGSGTSHSTPLVAGGAALAYQWLRSRFGVEPSSALVKAFLLNSTSYVTGLYGGDDLPGAHQGWGLMNLSRMFESTDRIIYEQSEQRTFTRSGEAPFEITGIITDPTKEFRAMLVWTDAPGFTQSDKTYVNQLNLEVIVGGVVYSGNNFSGQHSKPGTHADMLNNVQGVRLPAGVTGPFIIRVRPASIAGDGVPGNGIDLDQDFAFVITNGREMPVPELTVESSADLSVGVGVLHSDGKTDQSLIPGETARINVTVKNLSRSTAATITNAGFLLNSKGQFQPSAYSVIQAGESAISSVPFEIQVPSNLRCGSAAVFELQLETSVGKFTLPVRLQVGRSDGAVELMSDDVDGGLVKWKRKKFEISFVSSMGGSQSYRAVDAGTVNENRSLGSMVMKKGITIPSNAGQARLTFFHIFHFEPNYDGGVLEVSDDGGETWKDVGSQIITGGYDGRVNVLSENPLGTRSVWTAGGRAGIFSQVVINLDQYAGKKIKLRFMVGFDDAVGIREGYTGWFIDDIRVTANLYKCQ